MEDHNQDEAYSTEYDPRLTAKKHTPTVNMSIMGISQNTEEG